MTPRPPRPALLTTEALEDRWPEVRVLWKLWQALRQWAALLRLRLRPPA